MNAWIRTIATIATIVRTARLVRNVLIAKIVWDVRIVSDVQLNVALNTKFSTNNSQRKNTSQKKEQILELIKTPEGQRQFEDKFEEVKISVPHKYIHGNHNENCTGDYIYHSKNCHDCYNVNDAEDCGYLIDAVNKTKDCYDIMAMEEAQMCYEGISNWGFNMSFCVMSWFSSNMEYCELCQTCQDCFGCIGMRSKKFHILNEPYEEAEYRRITKSIKDDMRSKNLYNRWFPPSTFKYEDTLAQDIWPRPTPKTSAGRTI